MTGCFCPCRCESRARLSSPWRRSPRGGQIARALGESIVTEADDLQSLREMVRDALICHFEEAERPRVFRLHLVRDEVLAV